MEWLSKGWNYLWSSLHPNSDAGQVPVGGAAPKKKDEEDTDEASTRNSSLLGKGISDLLKGLVGALTAFVGFFTTTIPNAVGSAVSNVGNAVSGAVTKAENLISNNDPNHPGVVQRVQHWGHRHFGEPDVATGALLDATADKYHIDRAAFKALADIESGFNPHAVSSTHAEGMFQFTGATRRFYQLINPFDPAQAADAAARDWNDKKAHLTQVLGRDAKDSEVYMVYQQGKGGDSLFRHLREDDTTTAWQAMRENGMSEAAAKKVINVNGGNDNMTARDFVAKFTQGFEERQEFYGGSPASGQQVASASTGQSGNQQQPSRRASNLNALIGHPNDHEDPTESAPKVSLIQRATKELKVLEQNLGI